MSSTLEVLFSPAEFVALRERSLQETVCVVFDVLRATSSMMTALANGAESIIPVVEIAEALAVRASRPGVLLAGERGGLRIRAEQTGGVAFDIGNSPREFTPALVRGKTIVMSTTNGTRALRACASAKVILIGSFLSLGAVTKWILQKQPVHLLLVCAGTLDQAAYEDTLAAGALAAALWPLYDSGLIADSATMARELYRLAAPDLRQAMSMARNGRRLLSNSDLRDDVAYCARRDTIGFTAQMSADGVIRPV
jgi:2-phosphosulfolactate phosphatase